MVDFDVLTRACRGVDKASVFLGLLAFVKWLHSWSRFPEAESKLLVVGVR
jgi:hypothetical protein